MGSTIFHPGIQGIPSPMADANFYNDPEAAQIVLRCGAKITLVGMDVTMKVLLTAAMREEIAGDGGVGGTMMRIAKFYVKAYETCIRASPAAACTIRSRWPSPRIRRSPTIERMCVDVELAGALTRGQIVADRRRTADGRRNADVCMEANGAEFARRFGGGAHGARRMIGRRI